MEINDMQPNGELFLSDGSYAYAAACMQCALIIFAPIFFVCIAGLFYNTYHFIRGLFKHDREET